MIQEWLRAFILIFIAEMGDKTQILAMAFATKFPVGKVLLGIFLGSLFNHGLAVILGSYISGFLHVNTIQIIAGFAFVGFALWTLKPEEDDEQDKQKKSKFGPVLTVALAFFVGELGDKTQLTAITLATDSMYPLFTLAGTVSGMIVTGGIGIIIGKKLGDKIPEVAIKLIAASVFMFFGITKLYQTIPSQYLTSLNIGVFIGVISIVVFILVRKIIIRRYQGRESAFIKRSRELYNYYHQVEEKVNRICLGTADCGTCKGSGCLIGHTKSLIQRGLDGSQSPKKDILLARIESLDKNFNRKEVIDTLRMTLKILKEDPNNMQNENIHGIRRNLELILFGKSFDTIVSWDEYINFLNKADKSVAMTILKDEDLR